MRDVKQEDKKIPLNERVVSKLGNVERKALERYGYLKEADGEYYIPESVRYALGYDKSKRGGIKLPDQEDLIVKIRKALTPDQRAAILSKMIRDGFLPYESVLVRAGLDFCPVYEDGFAGYLPQMAGQQGRLLHSSVN